MTLLEDAASREPLELFREVTEDSYVDFSWQRRWKEETGGRLLGYFPVYFPEPIAHSLGFLPVNILGASGYIELEKATAHTQSFVCSISRSTFELAATGHLDHFDALAFTNICDVARNLSGIIKRNKPDKTVVYLHMPINNAVAPAKDYLYGEYGRLIEKLEPISGRKLDMEALRRSIAIYNEKWELQHRMEQLRIERPWLLPYDEYYYALRAGQLLPVELYVEKMRSFLGEVEKRDRKQQDKIRMLVLGDFCEQPALPLMRAMEDAVYLVYDESIIGPRWIGRVDGAEEDPLMALVKAYTDNLKPLTTRYHPLIDKQQHIAELVKDLRIDAVLFLVPKFCEPALYDFVIRKLALDKMHIPYVKLEYEESETTFENGRMTLETLAESIIFG
jgi:benzoyl-CoA reductase subunit C